MVPSADPWELMVTVGLAFPQAQRELSEAEQAQRRTREEIEKAGEAWRAERLKDNGCSAAWEKMISWGGGDPNVRTQMLRERERVRGRS